jgi:adenylosuccinate synthase
VIGANYGDEGKGLMTDFFAAQAPGSIVARFNGGCQAGHTVTTPEGHRHVFSHFGSGLLAGADTYLSRHFAVNPALFFKERNLLATALGKHTLYVDHRAPVTTFFDMLLNQAVEAHRGQARHGSCGMGFGETIGRHESAYALSVGDLLDKDGLYEKLVRIRDEYVPARRKALGLPDDGPHNTLFSSDTLVEAFLQVAADFMAEVVVVPNARAALQAHPVVLEGAQGLLLDQTNGAFPHVTRSNTGLANALDIAIESGIQALDVTNFTLKIEHAIPDTFLSCISSTYHPFKFGDIKLMSISPKDIMPSINAYHFNGIYLRMSLKSFQRINNNRFIIHIDKLFWNVLTHSLT